MAEARPWEERARSVEDVHRLRLRALLNDLVRAKGRHGAAEALKVDPRTLAASLERDGLTVRVQVALESLLISEGGTARQRERFEVLERAVGDLRCQVQEMQEGMTDAVAREVGPAVDRATQEMRERLERAVAEMTSRSAGQGSAKNETSGPGTAGTRAGAVPFLYPRPRQGVVTKEPYPGEEESYGGGMERVAEWRERVGRRGVGTRLEQVRNRERIMELEIEMIGDWELTLPPNTVPLYPSEREGYLGWRRRALVDIQRERLRREVVRWVRMGLTLGWWKD